MTDTTVAETTFAPRYRHRGLILAVMCAALVMVVAGVSMLAVALPTLAADLDASQSSQQWIVDAYALVLAALLLPAGAIGDRYGRRSTLIAGTGIFAIASVLSATVGSAGPLIALRALTGLGAALLMPGTLSTITSVFPPEERAKAVGIWAGFAAGGGTIGILTSGILLEEFWWGSIFVATAAIAILACAGVIAFVPNTRAEEKVSFDPRGAVLSVLGFGLLVLGIIEGPERGWTNPLTLVGLIGGVVFIVAFIWAELHTDEPMLDPRLFRLRGFATGSASLFLQFFAMFGFFFVSLQYLQIVLGYSTLESALALLPMTLILVPVSVVAGTLSERYGHRLIGGLGLLLSAVGFGFFATLGTDSGFWPFLAWSALIAVGAALAMTPATNAIVASLPRAKQGVASAVNDTARELGAAFGVAVLGSAFNTGYRNSIDGDLAGLPASVAKQAREAPAIAVQVASHIPGGQTLADAAREAFTTGMRYAVLVGMGMLVIGTLFVWFRGASRTEEVVEDELDEVTEPAVV